MASDVENRQPNGSLAEIGDYFSRKLHNFNPDNYNIYHFEEHVVGDRKYLYRPSLHNDLITVVLQYKQKMRLLACLPCPNNDPIARINEVHEYVVQSEAANG